MADQLPMTPSLTTLPSTCLPTVLDSITSFSELIDEESGSLRKPFDDPFGDACWRSSWMYASLLVLYELDRKSYERFTTKEKVDISHARTFVRHFAEKCASNNGFKVFGSDQKYSRDQLLPLMYFLSCVKQYDRDKGSIDAAESIVKNLRELQSHGRSLCNDGKGNMGPNISYLIMQLCEQYGVNYKWKTRPAWMAAALPIAAANVAKNVEIQAENAGRKLLGKESKDYKETDNDKIANAMHKEFLRQCFAAALSFSAQSAQFEGSKQKVEFKVGSEEFKWELEDVVNDYSVFNALGALSQLRVRSGKVTSDLSSWRGKLKNMSRLSWGPAFDIVCGRNLPVDIDDAFTWRTHPDDDKDLIQSQRAKLFMDKRFPARRTDGVKTLDGLVLSALALLWN